LLVLADLQASGCFKSPSTPSDVLLTCESDPKPPRVGKNELIITLTGSSGQRVAGARVQLEGDMSHAGMSPVFSETREVTAGVYRGTLELNMRGDWTILAHITLEGGQTLDREIKFQNVQAI
jgi:YtkA-like protein